MPARKSKAKHSRTSRQTNRHEPAEGRTAELLTIAWTVSVTGVLIADLLSLGTHFLANHYAEVLPLRAIANLLLLLAAGMGAVSCGLLIGVWRYRSLKPPQGYVIFALVAALAPMATVLIRLLT